MCMYVPEVVNNGLLGVLTLWVISTFLFLLSVFFTIKIRCLKRKTSLYTVSYLQENFKSLYL